MSTGQTSAAPVDHLISTIGYPTKDIPLPAHNWACTKIPVRYSHENLLVLGRCTARPLQLDTSLGASQFAEP
jgi:hypothetical protein